MRDCNALVNLIGIKRQQGTQTFERVHVEATRHLIEAARELGIRRYIHISVDCSRPDSRSAYHDTKWRAEELIRSSGLNYTILKPGVVYGPGDDMVSHLVKMIRFAPVFPVVGRGDSLGGVGRIAVTAQEPSEFGKDDLGEPVLAAQVSDRALLDLAVLALGFDGADVFVDRAIGGPDFDGSEVHVVKYHDTARDNQNIASSRARTAAIRAAGSQSAIAGSRPDHTRTSARSRARLTSTSPETPATAHARAR
jgi:hypothetical protein